MDTGNLLVTLHTARTSTADANRQPTFILCVRNDSMPDKLSPTVIPRVTSTYMTTHGFRLC